GAGILAIPRGCRPPRRDGAALAGAGGPARRAGGRAPRQRQQRGALTVRAHLAPALLLAATPPAAAQEPARRPPPARRRAQAPRRRVPRLAERAFEVQVCPLRRARMGVTVSVEPQATDSIGALVTAVSPGGPADRAGLRSGDLVVRLSGRSVLADGAGPGGAMARTVSPGMRLIELASRLHPNDTVAVEFRRGRERRTASLVTAPEPDYQA